MTIERPATIEEMKKNTGMNGEYHRGCILLGAMRNSAPSEDWCIVDSTTPRMVSGMVKHSTALRMVCIRGRRRTSQQGASFMPRSHSRPTGDHSMNSTVR